MQKTDSGHYELVEDGAAMMKESGGDNIKAAFKKTKTKTLMKDNTTQMLEYSITVERRLKTLVKQRAELLRHTELVESEIEKIRIIKARVLSEEPEMIFI